MRNLWLAAALFAAAAAAAGGANYAEVRTDQAVTFPKDFGSHPDFRTEWWYVTGWLKTTDGEPLGFQITFFRTKPDIEARNPSAFAPRQLLIAHCAISDPKRGRLWQDQRIRRAGLGLAEAEEGDTHVWIEDWTLQRQNGMYTAHIAADGFALDLSLADTQPPMLNGSNGVSRKGPSSQSTSYYYSVPHMAVAGSIARNGAASAVTGEAWFDHEWSSEYLDEQSGGWDWIGINLSDGSALMAFRMRGLDGKARWAGASLRSRDGTLQTLDDSQVHFEAGRQWQSPRTGTRYPVEWTVSVGSRQFELKPLLDDQENDTRLSTGNVYWEGAVRAYEHAQPAGVGYLELTGYGDRVKLR
jgi:predicted secreted hydrolase